MPSGEGDKLSKIEDLKRKLWSRNYEPHMHPREMLPRGPDKKVPEGWTPEEEGLNFWEKIFMRTPVFKKFFIFSAGFFVLAVGYASFVFFFKGNTVSNDNIEINVLGNTFTAGGEELSLVVEVANKNSVPLELVDLVVEYLRGPGEGGAQDTERYRESLGTIPSGTVKSENVKLVLFGEQGSVSPIRLLIEYRVEGSNAIFIKERTYEVSIDSTPLEISINAPTTSNPNEEITLDLKTTLNATKPASKVLLRVDYPLGFQFTSAKPAPAFGNNVWNLGDLIPGAEQHVVIDGKLLDVFPGEEKTFRVQGGSQSSSDKSAIDVVFNFVTHVVAIDKPIIEAKLYINGVSKREHAAESRGEISGEIRWANNLETKINDFSIEAHLSGNALDRKSIDANQGFYNSLQNTIVWDKNSISQFREIDPGEAGSVTFSFAPVSLLSSSAGSLSDPSISIEVTARGKQPLESSDLENLVEEEETRIRISSEAGFAAKALFYSGPFQNKGPIPPQAEKETTYTIIWTLSNSSSAISKAKVTSSLPPWVKFIEPAGGSESILYNPSTKEIVWDVGTIPKGAGITAPSKEISFQVSLTPSLSQIGTTPTLVNDAVLTGTDDFANVPVRVNKPSLNTRLSNDPTFPNFGDRVVE